MDKRLEKKLIERAVMICEDISYYEIIPLCIKTPCARYKTPLIKLIETLPRNGKGVFNKNKDEITEITSNARKGLNGKDFDLYTLLLTLIRDNYLLTEQLRYKKFSFKIKEILKYYGLEDNFTNRKKIEESFRRLMSTSHRVMITNKKRKSESFTNFSYFSFLSIKKEAVEIILGDTPQSEILEELT